MNQSAWDDCLIIRCIPLQLLEVWLPLLSGPIPNLLQTADYQAVKSTLCDCLSNVGPSVFEQLPVGIATTIQHSG